MIDNVESILSSGESCPLCGGPTNDEARSLLLGLRDAAIKDAVVFPGENHGIATIVLPLPSDHWLTAPGINVPPAPWRIGIGEERDKLANDLRSIARYAIRCATMNGAEDDFDPDAMVQSFLVGALGYWTADGFSGLGVEEWESAAERQGE